MGGPRESAQVADNHQQIEIWRLRVKAMVGVPDKESNLVDPDFFGTLIVVLDTLASIGAFANEWMKFRENPKNRRLAQSYLTFKEVLRNIRRAHDDLFAELTEVLDIFAVAENRSLKALRSQPMGWASALMILPQMNLIIFAQSWRKSSFNIRPLRMGACSCRAF
jgi:hypothetical protein